MKLIPKKKKHNYNLVLERYLTTPIHKRSNKKIIERVRKSDKSFIFPSNTLLLLPIAEEKKVLGESRK